MQQTTEDAEQDVHEMGTMGSGTADSATGESSSHQVGRADSLVGESTLWPNTPYMHPPIVFMTESKPGGTLTASMNAKAHWSRFIWILLLAVIYMLLLQHLTHQSFLSGEVKEAMEEFFAEAGKTGERITEGEVTPGFKEYIHGDDVAKSLTWFQMFCMYKKGSDDHVPWAWHCDLNDIKVLNTHPVPWDVIRNADVYNLEEKAGNESKALQELICSDRFLWTHVIQGDDPVRVPWGDVERFRQIIASEYELDKDNSYKNTAKDPKNASESSATTDDSMTLDSNFVVKKSFNPNLNEAYDEYTVLSGNPMWEPMDERFDELEKNLQEKVQKIVAQLPKNTKLSDKEDTADVSLVEANPEKREDKGQDSSHPASKDFTHLSSLHEREYSSTGQWQMKHRDQNSRKRKRTTYFGRGVTQRRSHDGDIQTSDGSGCNSDHCGWHRETTQLPTVELRTQQSLLESEAPNLTLGSGTQHSKTKFVENESGDQEPCEDFDAPEDKEGLYEMCSARYQSDVVRILRQVAKYDLDWDGKLSKEEAKMVFRKGLRYSCSGFERTWRSLDSDSSGDVSVDELVQFSKDSKKFFKNAPPPLMNVCMNHHWSMIPLCGPQEISASFHIERANTDMQATREGIQNREALIDITMRFQQAGYEGGGRSSSSGWYKSSINVQVHAFYGHYSTIHGILGVLVLLFVSVLFLPDLLMTIIYLPWMLSQVLIPAKRQQFDTLIKVDVFFKQIQDARYVRSHFMSALLVAQENVFAISFYLACASSFIGSFKADVPMFGEFVNDACKELYEGKAVDFFKAHHYSMNHEDPMLVTPLQFIQTCLDPNASDVGAETIMQLFFDAKGYHAFAFFCLAIRLLDIFSAFDATRWVPQTIELSVRKILNFLLFYFSVIFAFACLLTFSVGNQIVQYNCLSRSAYVLVLFSFGFTDQALDLIQPFEDNTSFFVVMYLLIFAVLVISVAMQFFTTIVLDAYAQLSDHQEYQRKKLEEHILTLIQISHFLFPTACEKDDVKQFVEHYLDFESAYAHAANPEEDKEAGRLTIQRDIDEALGQRRSTKSLTSVPGRSGASKLISDLNE